MGDRPDFVGLDANQEWIVVEAKGRTGSGVQPNVMDKAKRQTRSLRNLNGQLPALRAAVGVNLSKQLEARIWDPEEYDDEAVDRIVDLEAFMRRYYEPLIDRAGLSRIPPTPHGPAGRLRRAALLPASDATLLIDDDIVSAYQNEDPIWQKVMVPKAQTEISVLREVTALRQAVQREHEAEGLDRLTSLIVARRRLKTGQAADGITIQLGPSWSTANMQREPQARTR